MYRNFLPFWDLTNILLCGCTMFCLSIHLWMDLWVDLLLWLYFCTTVLWGSGLKSSIRRWERFQNDRASTVKMREEGTRQQSCFMKSAGAASKAECGKPFFFFPSKFLFSPDLSPWPITWWKWKSSKNSQQLTLTVLLLTWTFVLFCFLLLRKR